MEIVIAILLFICMMTGFFIGLKTGIRVKKGLEPKGPIQAAKEYIERKAIEKEVKQEADEWELFEAVDGYTDEERESIRKNGGG